MREILTYVLQTVACTAMFVVFYRVVLQGRTSFRTARACLLASPVVATLIPALDIPLWRVAPIEIPLVPMAGSAAAAATTSTPPPVPPVDRAAIVLWALWGVGLVLLGVIMARQVARIAAIRRRAELHSADGFRIALSEEVGPPFSFLGTVFVGRGTPEGEMRQIVMHEASHIRHRHSAEKLAMEMAKNLQWFNPFAWWAARLLAEVHEFEADRDVLDGGSTVEEYLPLIFRQTFGYIPELSAGLGDSLTKKRFLMMKNKMKQTKNSWLRVAGVLPLAAGAMLLFSFTSHPPEIVFTEVPVSAAVEAPAVASAPEPAPAHVPPAAAPAAPAIPAAPAPVEQAVPAPAGVRQSPRSTQQTSPDAPIHNADVMPLFESGSLNDFRNWVQRQLNYPRAAMEGGISGTVTLRYVIERDGSLSGIEVLSSPHQLLSDEATRVVGLSPRWTPGSDKGKPVRVYYILPVHFGLEGVEPMPSVHSATVTSGQVVTVRDASGEEQTMVMGYGTQRRPDALQEVRVIGYGTQRRSDGGTPLMLLDGREITDEQLRAIDPNTIESIEVLKDRPSIELYGDRATNGVILIRTRGAGGTSSAVRRQVSRNHTTNTYFVWNARENRAMIDSDYTIKDGQKTIDGGIVIYTGEHIANLSPEIKAAMGNTRYDSVVVITPR